MIDKSLILNEIKNHLDIKTNKGFAEFLEIKATTLSMWYKRNTFDIELIFNKCEYLNPEWLLTGKGNMLKTQSLRKSLVLLIHTLEILPIQEQE